MRVKINSECVFFQGAPMHIYTRADLSRTMVVRDDNYIKEFNGFVAAQNLTVVSVAQQMEFDLLAFGGFPSGSHQAVLGLSEIPAQEWEQILTFMESQQKGSARLSLQLIEQQRIYERNAVLS